MNECLSSEYCLIESFIKSNNVLCHFVKHISIFSPLEIAHYLFRRRNDHFAQNSPQVSFSSFQQHKVYDVCFTVVDAVYRKDILQDLISKLIHVEIQLILER